MKQVYKKMACFILSAVIMFSGFSKIIGFADNTGNTCNIYQDNYDNGRSSCTPYDDVYGSVTYGSNIENILYQGNMGIAMASTAWAAKAISYTFKNPVSTGVINVSYDTGLLSRDGNQAAYVRLNDSKYVFYMNKDRGMYGPANNLSGYGDTSVTTPYIQNTVYTVNLVYDLTNKKAYTYVNDVLLTQRTISTGFTISSIDFYLSMANAYFDNLKISTMTNNSFSALSVGKVDRDGKTCDIYFSEEPKTASCILTGIGKNVTVTKGGQPVSITSITDLPGRALRLGFGNVLESGDYTITFGSSFVNIMNKPLAQASVNFEVIDYLYYQNTYDNGLSSCTAYDDAYGTVTYAGSRISSSFKGNPGIGMSANAWAAKAINYVFKEPVSTGIVSISFDTSMLSRVDANQQVYISLNDSKNVFYISKNRGMYGPANNLNGYGDTSVTSPYEPNTVYTVNLIYDMVNMKARTYVNGILLTERSIPAGFTIQSMNFYLSMVNAYFDNFSITEQFMYPVECSITSEKTGNIFFEDEPVRLNLNLKNRTMVTQRANFDIEIKDHSNNIVWTGTQHTDIESQRSKNIELNPNVSCYGVYTIAAVDNEGNVFSTLFSRSVRSNTLNFKIGACAHFDRPCGEVEKLMGVVEAAGIGYIRTDWTRPEISPGVFSDYFETDPKFSVYIRKSTEKDIGMMALIQVNSSLYPDADGGFYTSDQALAALENYCEWIADKFRGQVEYFEVGNEVNYYKNNDGNQASGSDYAKVLKAAYTGIKAGNPDAKVIAFASQLALDSFRQFVREALNAMRDEGKYYFDAISTHPYHIAKAPEIKDPALENTTWLEQSAKLNELLEEYGIQDKGKWASELGSFDTNTGVYGEKEGEDVASYYIRMLALNEAYNFHDKMFFYDMQNDGTDRSDKEQNFGLIKSWVSADWRMNTAYAAKPAYLTLANWNKIMTGAEFVDITKDESGEIYKCNFNQKGDKITVVWDVMDKGSAVNVEGETGIITVYDMYGNKIAQNEGRSSITVNAKSEPVYVVFKGQSEDNTAQDIKLSINGRTIAATVKNNGSQPLSAILIVGAYNGCQLTSVPILLSKFSVDNVLFNTLDAGKTGVISVTLDDSVSGKIKAFLWKDLVDISPLCKEASVLL